MKHLNVTLFLANTVKRCRWVSYTFLQYKSQVFSIFSEFEHHFEEISLFVKSTILGKSIFEGLDGVEMWWGKNSFTNQVVKDKMVFPLFFVKSNGFEFKRSIFDFFFSRVKKLGSKKVDSQISIFFHCFPWPSKKNFWEIISVDIFFLRQLQCWAIWLKMMKRFCSPL